MKKIEERELSIGSPEWIVTVLTNGGEVTFERTAEDLKGIAEREALGQVQYQVCLGGDPIVSPRTPTCILPQLQSMKAIQAQGVEPPGLLILQSTQWQLHETKKDSRGEPLIKEEIYAGSALSLALMKSFIDSFFPELTNKVSFAWLPYNQKAIERIDEWAYQLGDKFPEEIRVLAEQKSKSAENQLRYAARHILSYGVLSSKTVIGTGGVTEKPFQEVARLGVEAIKPEGPPLVLLVYPTFGASYYWRKGEPKLSWSDTLRSYTYYRLSPPLVETDPEWSMAEKWPKREPTSLGEQVGREFHYLQQATAGQYMSFLADFGEREIMKAKPEKQLIQAIKLMTGWSHAGYEQMLAAWLRESEVICQENIGWPTG